MLNNVKLRVEDLKVWFPVRRGLIEFLQRKPQKFVKAVDGISFYIKKGEIFGLVGESGCGKTTTARALMRLIEPMSGKIFFYGEDGPIELTSLNKKQLKKFRTKIQMIFQDPYESLDPKQSVFDALSEPLKVNKLVKNSKELLERILSVLEDVRLYPPESFIDRYPHELSGGQRQRVVIASALVLSPEIILADEPVSMLDVSIRGEVLRILLELKEKRGLTYLFITHDLSLARVICDRIGVMYLGKIVEAGSSEEVIKNPKHPYTKALVSVVPVPDPTIKREKIILKGEVPSPMDVPSGCRFHPRCPYFKEGVCNKEEPALMEISKEHLVACHLWEDI